MVKKFTLEHVQDIFVSKGYKLLETHYKDSRTTMRFSCPFHPDKETAIRLYDLKKGVGCKYCFNEKRKVMNKKFDLSSVKTSFEKEGYKLISKDYISSAYKLEYICLKHPDKVNKIRFSDFKNGVRCPHCKRDNFVLRIQKEGNPSWNGGITKLNERLRRELKEWKFNVLKEHNFKCFITGFVSNDLEIHHTMPFHKIRNNALRICDFDYKTNVSDFTDDQIEKIVIVFNELHKEVIGYPITKELHRKFHKLYGFDTKENDFLKFKEVLENGDNK